MSEFINRWFGRAARPPGALACGLRHNTGTVFNTVWETRFPEPTLTELWHRLDAMQRTVAHGASPEILRWLFTDSVVLATPRPDGAMFFVLLPRKSADETSVNRLFSEFRALRA